MPYRNEEQNFSAQMVSTFVVLAIVLLAMPVAASIFVCIANMNKGKRAKVMANAATTRTTVIQGPNGRTVFETTATRPAAPRSQRPAQSPRLPYNIQQAYQAPSARKPSLKNAWQRLSRPFSIMPQQYEEDQFELTQKLPPRPHKSKFQEQTKSSYEGPVSPITTPDLSRFDSSSSWNTVDRLDHTSDPISPLSVTNINASSVTGTVSRSFHSQRQPPAAMSHDRHQQECFDNIPLTPPTHNLSTKQTEPLSLGSARGFVPSHVDITHKQQVKDFAKQKGKEIAKQAVAAGVTYAATNIKTNIVDANKHKVSKVELAKPPKAKTKEEKAGFI